MGWSSIQVNGKILYIFLASLKASYINVKIAMVTATQ